ncbi:unnamed protein product [Ambrosiozyma monospora]|uniref:Unnamed protein product n=1 Tax=Ambrosiozyma monospora TaxID=43982 RepID=A0A9W7DDZ8_AMBMO|nr:unnamed protein product [Ambrosiozyma monospora]
MRFSTPVLFIILASSVMASTDVTASFTQTSYTVVSAPSSSPSAAIDPNDPVQKSIIDTLGKVLTGGSLLGGILGNHNSKMKREIDELSLPGDGSSGSSINLNDPVQKAVWSNIGKAVVGNLSKRDYEELTEEQRKGLGTWLKQIFGLDQIHSQDFGIHKREDATEKLNHLVVQLAGAVSASASRPAVSSATISTLL